MTDNHADLEARLRAYRPAAPSRILRARVLEAAARESRRPTVPAWTIWAAAAAAITLLSTGLWTRSATFAIDALVARSALPPPRSPAEEDELAHFYGDSPDVRAWAREVLASEARDAPEERARQLFAGERP